MRILIAVPTYENIDPGTYKGIYDIDPDGNDLQFDFVRGYDVAAARNNIVKKTLELGVDYVLMVDNDVILPRDILKIMTDDLKDVCLGYYAHRNANRKWEGKTNVCERHTKNFAYQYTAAELKGMLDKGIHKFEIRGGGMGCAFINANVFRKIEFPWYFWQIYKDGHGTLSEDLYFCVQCRINKIPVYTDTRAKCGHVIRYAEWMDV